MAHVHVTEILERFRNNRYEERQAAAKELWARLAQPMRRLAKQKLGGGAIVIADDEDVAISVFRSFFRGIDDGRFDQLASSGQVWALLARLTRNKAVDWIRYHNSQCRNASPVVAESSSDVSATAPAETHGHSSLGTEMLDQICDQKSLSAEELSCWDEQMNELVIRLSESTLKEIVTMRLRGYSCEEIAKELGCVERTVQRKLALIRRLWGDVLEEADVFRGMSDTASVNHGG